MTKREISVARLELCKELFEVSGWDDTSRYWYQDWLLQNAWRVTYLGVPSGETYPAYDLGYLLRKLQGVDVDLCYMDDRWHCWPFGKYGAYVQITDSPEESAARLAIALFKDGKLQRGEA